jgi:hypothetical protein
VPRTRDRRAGLALGGSKLEPDRGQEMTPRKQMNRVHVGSRVRVADGAILDAALRGPAERRPEPGQMLWAGQPASVTGYQRDAEGRSLYVLRPPSGL